MIGKSAFAAAAGAQSKQASPQFEGTSEIQEINVIGDWAFMWTKLKVVVTAPGGAPPMTRAGPTLSILKKQNGRWLLARDANMLSPVQKRRPMNKRRNKAPEPLVSIVPGPRGQIKRAES